MEAFELCSKANAGVPYSCIFEEILAGPAGVIRSETSWLFGYEKPENVTLTWFYSKKDDKPKKHYEDKILFNGQQWESLVRLEYQDKAIVISATMLSLKAINAILKDCNFCMLDVAGSGKSKLIAESVRNSGFKSSAIIELKGKQ